MSTTWQVGDFMQQQASTFTGAMAIIKTNVQLASAQAFQPLFQMLSDIAVKIALFVQTPTFQQWVSQIAAAVGARGGVAQGTRQRPCARGRSAGEVLWSRHRQYRHGDSSGGEQQADVHPVRCLARGTE